ncbi:AraC family transcriptional regulator [Sulfuriferula thiophila]|uniref:AraC family transcriptional regulator n=1 Tax=Sulfuriferula thiophila TaxID=1781211 RepID=UPI000F60895E|nr:helix-turn-helix domain-containing protein [Sulfuriferula thiophila]
MHALAILLTGFSIFSALTIALTHFRRVNYAEQIIAQWLGVGLLFALASLQLVHFSYLQYGSDLIHLPFYRAMLFTVAPIFYLYSKPLLQAQIAYRPYQLLHGTPVLIAPFLTYQIALPLAFAVGAGYLVLLARSVYALRENRSRFRVELAMLGMVFLIAVIVLFLGLILPLLDEKMFFMLYASAIGCAFLLVSLALNFTPQLSTEVKEAARETYAVSTLANVDCNEALSKLAALMERERLFESPDIDLPTLATHMALTNHQLSELINGQLGKGFSRYIREYRIEAAKKMLLTELSASILSVGLSVGFTSQSNFYDAFRDITGMTPGHFRKINAKFFPK